MWRVAFVLRFAPPLQAVGELAVDDVEIAAERELFVVCEAAEGVCLATEQSGTYVAPAKVTLGRFLADWLEQKESTVKSTTLASYGLTVQQITKALGTRRLQALNPGEINAFYGTELARGLSAKSVRNTHGVLHKALHDAERWGVIVKTRLPWPTRR